MGTARSGGGSDGALTSGIFMGGFEGPPAAFSNKTELYDGTSWSTTSTLGTGRQQGGASHVSPSNSSSILFGGSTAPTNGVTKTEPNLSLIHI